MPSKSPLWSNNWLSNNFVISLSDGIWSSSSEEVHITNTTCCHHFNVNITWGCVIIDPPILGCSVINEDSKPWFISSFTENEWMGAISILIWISDSLLWVNNISIPQAVHTVWKEQIRSGLLNQSHDSLEASPSGSSINMSFSIDDIDVFSKGHFTGQSEEGSLILNLNFEFFGCGV